MKKKDSITITTTTWTLSRKEIETLIKIYLGEQNMEFKYNYEFSGQGDLSSITAATSIAEAPLSKPTKSWSS